MAVSLPSSIVSTRPPDEEKLRGLADYVRRFGYKLKVEGGSSVIAKSLNALLADIKGKPEEDMLTMQNRYPLYG